MLYDEKIEALISAALVDGVLTEKEKTVLFRKAQEQGINLDEFEMVLDARLLELQKATQVHVEVLSPTTPLKDKIIQYPRGQYSKEECERRIAVEHEHINELQRKITEWRTDYRANQGFIRRAKQSIEQSESEIERFEGVIAKLEDKERAFAEELRSIIMSEIKEHTSLSRIELRETILQKVDCPLSTYLEVEEQILESTYSTLVNNKVIGDKVVNDDILNTLARLLEKDNNAEIKVRKRMCKKAWITQLLTFPWGCLGIDRFYLGDTKKGILKLITFGGVNIWTIVDIFTARRRTKEYNAKLLEEKFGSNTPTI